MARGARMAAAGTGVALLLIGCAGTGVPTDEREPGALGTPEAEAVAGPADGRVRASGDIALDGVDGVHLVVGGELTVRRGSTPSLTVEAPRRVQGLLADEVRDGVLVLDAPGVLDAREADGLSYELVLPALSEVVVRGAGCVRGEGVTDGDLLVRVEGPGRISLDGLDVGAVRVDVEGPGAVELAGRAATAVVAVAGTGRVDMGRLRTDDADVAVHGPGELELDVVHRLVARVDGTGTVAYRGDPEVTQEVSGPGSVRKR